MMKNLLMKKLKSLAPKELLSLADDQIVEIDSRLPSSKDLSLLKEFLIEDLDYKNLNINDQKIFFDKIIELERQKPVINTSGKPVLPIMRLKILKEIEKAIFFRDSGSLNSLRCIIVDPLNLFLCQNSDAAGLAKTGGPKNMLQSLNTTIDLSHSLKECPPAATPKFSQLIKDLENLSKSISQKKLTEFKKQQYLQKWSQLKSDFITITQAALEFYNKYPDVEPIDVKATVAFIQKALSDIKEVALKTKNQSDIYISWPYFSSNHHLMHPSHIILHEVAHVLDFEFKGLDGIPSPAQNTSSVEVQWEQRWVAQFERMTTGAYNFLGNYALTNEKEFLAVSTELFFTRPDLLKEQSIELFELLKETYGFVPMVKKMGAIKRSFKLLSYYKKFNDEADEILGESA